MEKESPIKNQFIGVKKKMMIQHRNSIHATYLQPHTNKAANIEDDIKIIIT